MAADKNSVSLLSSSYSSSARFKREDHKRTKHDSHFSKWQILIGAFDWEDYAQGKEGAARYRVHSLPSSSVPGLYELGVAVAKKSGSGSGRCVGKLDPDDIAVVYLGQAENVRSRLQRYGRCGAHLGNGYANGDFKSESSEKEIGLFEEIFSGGHSIVYRWASMRDKGTAENTEAQLLDTFDYAWNKGSNGARRPKDIIQKLGQIASSSHKFSRIFSKKLMLLHPGQVGIKIEAGGKAPLPQECTVDEKSFLHGIFKFSRWQPRSVSVSEKCGIDENSSNICGIITSEGIPCKQPPVPGRKRCKQHKGMRIYGIIRTKPIAQGNSQIVPDMHPDSSSIICGVNLGDGNFCRKEAVSGRKRCKEHKGMGITKSSIKHCNTSPSSNISSVNNEQCALICGATSGNGSVCRRQPIQGNKRCFQHKGRRAAKVATFCGVDDGSSTLKCGVGLEDGSICIRTPISGRKRCEEHKGIKVTTKTISLTG